MADYTWEDNTRDIFDKAVSLAPKPFQSITRKSLSQALEKRLEGGGTVTQDIIVDCIKEVTPKPFLAMGMKKIKPMLRTP